MKLRHFFKPSFTALFLVTGTACCAAADFGLDTRYESSEAKSEVFKSAPKFGIERKEILRRQSYARMVWMPEKASANWGGTKVSFGLASLNTSVRRQFDQNASGLMLMPVVSMPMFGNKCELTFIPNLSGGGHGKAMMALQIKLGS